MTLASASAAFGQATAKAPARLTFPVGSTRLVVVGDLDPGGTDRYVVSLSAGQLLMLRVDSAPGAVELRLSDASTNHELTSSRLGAVDYQGLVPRSGDYFVDVCATPSQAMGISSDGGLYGLTVEAPAPVHFRAGGVAAVREGPTPGGLPVDYLLGAHKGQTLLLDLRSPGGETSITVSDVDERVTFAAAKPAPRRELAVRLPTDGDYVVSVAPVGGKNVAYTLDIVVPAISLPEKPLFVDFPAPGRIVVVNETKPSIIDYEKAVYSSIDNGASWRTAVSPGSPVHPGEVADLPPDGEIVGLDFRNGQDGFMAITVEWEPDGSLGPFLCATSDGGATWSPVKLPIPKEFRSADSNRVAGVTPSAPSFADDEHGSMMARFFDSSGSFQDFRFATSDGGATWAVSAALAPLTR